MSYVRKYGRTERLLHWLINRLDAWSSWISERQWAKHEAKQTPDA